jgi:hypothetical protein
MKPILLGAWVLFAATNVAAGGQSAAREGKWEIEVHGGGTISTSPARGTGSLPPAGATITNPAFNVNGRPVTTHVVSSWYFGDGASLLNRALPFVRAPIIPLDSVLESPFVRRTAGGSAGFRVTRSFTRRVSAEFSFDYSLGVLALTRSSKAGLEDTRRSFENTWNAILGQFYTSQAVSSVATMSDRTGRQFLTTGTIIVDLTTPHRVTPYLAVGAGLISATGASPSAALTGDYRFRISPPPNLPFPISLPEFHETDSVTAHSSIDNAPAAVFGGGAKFGLSRHWGVRVDVRNHLNRNSIVTRVDAKPTVALSGTSGSAITSIGAVATNESLQFSTTTATPSSLSGSPISGFTSFRGKGIENHLNITTGLYWRF